MKKNSRFIQLLAFCFLFIFTQPTIGQDLDKAEQLADSGKLSEAVNEYNAWLESNPDSPEFSGISIQAANLEPGIENKTIILQRAAGKSNDPEVRHGILVMLAEIEELAGNPVSSQQFYQDASFAVPGSKDFESLLRSALLLLDLGEYRTAEAQSRAIIDTCREEDVKNRAIILLSRIYYMTDREQEALDFFYMDEEWQKKPYPPEGLLWIFELSKRLKVSDLSAIALEELAARYPDSLELSLISGDAEYLPSPSTFITLADGAESKTVPPQESTNPIEEATAISIQTGSFSVKENAEYATADLKAEGFDTRIVERIINDKTFYRVIVPDVELDNLQEILLQLKEKGFEGFPLYE
jgi:hypothetical protein